MSKVHLTPVSLITTVAAVGILLAYATVGNHFGYETTIAGLTLLLILFAFDDGEYRSAMQSLAFGAASGLCVMLLAVYPINLLMQPKSPEQWSAMIWVASTLLVFAVDRMKATSRESKSMGLAPTPAPFAYTAPTAAPAPVPISTIATFRPVTPAPTPTPVAKPAPVQPAPVPVEPTFFEPPPTAIPDQPAPTVIATQPAAAPLEVAPIPPGREALIFLNLLGEGLNVLRSVRAEHLGRDYYRIADVMPEGERWEYQPNQVVRCRKKALSNGKHLVAFEEAQRAQ